MNDLYAREWRLFTTPFKPTFKLLKREKKGGKPVPIYERQPQTPYQRLLETPDIAEAVKAKLRAEHARLDPFEGRRSVSCTTSGRLPSQRNSPCLPDAFSLTRALSRREKEKLRRCVDKVRPAGARGSDRWCSLSQRERVGVRENGCHLPTQWQEFELRPVRVEERD